MVRRSPEVSELGAGLRLRWPDGGEQHLGMERVELGEAEASCGSGKLKAVVEWRVVTPS